MNRKTVIDIIKVEKLMPGEVVYIMKLQALCGLSPWTKNDYLDEIKRVDGITITAKKDNKIIGFAIARLITNQNITSNPVGANRSNTNQSNSENEMEIYNIAVVPDYRQQGVGSLLLENLHQTAVCCQVEQVWLEVRKSNASAIKFYQENSFVEQYQRKNFYRNPIEDAIVMKSALVLDGNRK